MSARCKHCGKTLRRTNWYDGPGWSHDNGQSVCTHLHAEPETPACAACDRPVEVLPSGVMVHPDGTGHEEWPNGRRVATPKDPGVRCQSE